MSREVREVVGTPFGGDADPLPDTNRRRVVEDGSGDYARTFIQLDDDGCVGELGLPGRFGGVMRDRVRVDRAPSADLLVAEFAGEAAGAVHPWGKGAIAAVVAAL